MFEICERKSTVTAQDENKYVIITSLSCDSTKRCYWLQQFCLMNTFQHVRKPAIIAAYCMQKLRTIIAHEITA